MIQPGANKKHCKIRKAERWGKRKTTSVRKIMIDHQHPTVGSTRKGEREEKNKRRQERRNKKKKKSRDD